jgi:hypothetical protein
MIFLKGEKVGICGSTQITKKMSQQIQKSVTFSDYLSPQICGPPSFVRTGKVVFNVRGADLCRLTIRLQ